MSDLEPSYPLHWPAGWPRTRYPEKSKFGTRGNPVSMSHALDGLESELRMLGAINYVVSTNVQTRLDGRPRANQGRPMDTGVAVYFTLAKARKVLACDKWNRPEDNLWAICKHIEALRGQNRWGVGSIDQAFAGYTALAYKTTADPWETLGIARDATEAQILAAWREKAKSAHPDAGGSHEAFSALSQAKDIALATLRSSNR